MPVDFRTPEQVEADGKLAGTWHRCPEHGLTQTPILMGDLRYCPNESCNTQVITVAGWGVSHTATLERYRRNEKIAKGEIEAPKPKIKYGLEQVPLTAEQNKLVEDHYKLVTDCAKRYAKKHSAANLDDLVSAGTTGLMDAARKFNPGMNVKFTTYAKTRILGAMMDDLRSMDIVPRLERIKASKGEEADIKTVVSADAAVDEKGHSLVSTLTAEPPKALFIGGDDVWQRVRDRLPQDAARIITEYYRDGKNMKTIAIGMDLTESRVCQIHGQAISELQTFGGLEEFHDPDFEPVKLTQGDGMTSKIIGQVEEISPEKAKALLATQKRNRPVRSAKVLRFLHQMRTGGWKMNGEPIIISDLGRLIEGQHRLRAVVLFGKPVMMFVVHGVDDDSSKTINTGTSRTASDVLFMYDGLGTPTDARITSTALRWLWKLENKVSMFSVGICKDPVKATPREPAPYELLELAKKHPKMREAVIWARGKSSQLPGFRDGPMAFLYYVCSQKNDRLARKFFGQLISGADLSVIDPCYKLRQRLISISMGKTPGGGVEYLACAIKAWNAVRDGETIEVLSWKRVEGFPEIR